MPLDEWQEQVLEAAMGERADGRWASKFVGMSVPRQNGKSQMIVARALAGILLFGEKVIIISAHETDTAREIWKRLIDVIESNPTLEVRVSGRMDAINREYLSFGTGKDRQEIKLKARRANGSRGFSADCLLLDEAQILGKRSWGSIVPTMSARPNPQLWLFGTPPTEDDDPFAFSRVRESSESKKARHCWLEWGADPGDDIDSPDVWAKANPSYGVRISHEAIADDRAAMADDQFRQERLGMWNPAVTDAGDLDLTGWLALADPTAERGFPTFGVDVDESRLACIGVGWDREDGGRQVMLTQDGKGLADVNLSVQAAADRLLSLTTKHGGLVMLGGAAAEALSDRLERDGVEFEVVTGMEFAGACGHVADGISDGSLHHGNQPELNESVRQAKWRSVGTAGERAWQLKNANGIGPLAAVTRALHGLSEMSGGGVMSL